ncbi:MAG: hypothetical protein JSW33_01245, partial [bacterium]
MDMKFLFLQNPWILPKGPLRGTTPCLKDKSSEFTIYDSRQNGFTTVIRFLIIKHSESMATCCLPGRECRGPDIREDQMDMK